MLLPLILLVRRLEGQGMGSQQSSPNVCDGKIPPQLRFQSNKKNPLTFKPKRANLWGQTCVKCFFGEKSIICTTNHFLVQKSTFLILSLNLKRISSSQKVYGNLFIWFFILGHLGTIPSPRAFVGPPLAGTCLPTGVESPAMLGYWRGNWNGFWNLKAKWFGGKHVVRKDFENPMVFLLFENPIEEVVYLSFISHIGICLSVKQGSFFLVPFRYAWFSNLSWGIRGLMSLSPYFRETSGSLDPSNIYMYNIYIYICDIYAIYIYSYNFKFLCFTEQVNPLVFGDLELLLPPWHWLGPHRGAACDVTDPSRLPNVRSEITFW